MIKHVVRPKMSRAEIDEAVAMYLAGHCKAVIMAKFRRGRRTIMEMLARELPPSQRRKKNWWQTHGRWSQLS